MKTRMIAGAAAALLGLSPGAAARAAAPAGLSREFGKLRAETKTGVGRAEKIAAAGRAAGVFAISPAARRILSLLRTDERVPVRIPPEPLARDRTSYATYATRGAMNCLRRLDREFGVPESESCAQDLSDEIDPRMSYSAAPAKRFHLSVDDLLFVDDYTGGYYYGPINSALRSGDLKDYSCYINGLEAALLKFPEYEGNAIRGTDLPDEVLAKYVPGAVVADKAFTSATEGDALSEDFQDEPVVMKIISKHARDVSALNEDESEAIFMPGTRFRVLSRAGPTKDDPTVRLRLEELDPGVR